ncbi:Uma2 family endonuclease [Mucilaginibacter daejeonensis]|uniref:Uma2 family endonuclease n=1 Tax=Mucilaginibacter daejeonensis TaxID=398049 RepID=UPI001D173975|nr:Uma2 family endonuclease [Mucilaginibacter daejeonensis]UEG52617.1 Uma2 family endonuclease [Mucilaginibacter daejeonensis]
MRFSDLDLSKSYTYADYLKWQFDERLELIKGKIFKMSPAPSVIHQRLSGRVFLKLGNYLAGKACEVFNAPLDVRLTRTVNDAQVTTVLQPDVCVICDPTKIDARGAVGAPDIVVEILSPGNNNKELQTKYDVYEEAGVQEYWIIHPSERTFLKYTLANGSYVASRLLTGGDQVTTPILPGFVLDLEEVFKDL